MKIRPGTDWAMAHKTSPSCDTWRSTSCKRTQPRDPCAASSSVPAGTTITSPDSSLYSEVRLPWMELGGDEVFDHRCRLKSTEDHACDRPSSLIGGFAPPIDRNEAHHPAIRPLQVDQLRRRRSRGTVGGAGSGDGAAPHGFRRKVEAEERPVDHAGIGIQDGEILRPFLRPHQLALGIALRDLEIGQAGRPDLALERVTSGGGDTRRPAGIAQPNHALPQTGGKRLILAPP